MTMPIGRSDSVQRAMRVVARLRAVPVASNLIALVCALGVAAPAAAQMQVATGSYVGNGLPGGQAVTVGFQPDAVFVKGNTNQAAVVSTATMLGMTKDHNAGGILQAGLITALTATGFNVGNATIDARVNQNGIVYHWTALKAAAGELQVGVYSGNGGVSQSVPVAFQPDWVAIFGDGAGLLSLHRNSSLAGANSVFFRSSGPAASMITGFVPTGFTVGNSPHVNSNTVPYHFIAVKNTPGRFASGVFTGDGLDNRNITGIGLQPRWIAIRHTTIARSSVHRADTLPNDISLAFDNTAAATNQVQALLADGFQVGTDTEVNALGATMMWVAFGGPSGSSLVRSGKYTGNGVDDRPVYVGFQPDVVFVKRAGADPQRYAVVRTSTMGVDNTKDLQHTGPLALAPDLVQSLTPSGFTVGTATAVNENGTEYHWVAFKAGAGELAVGTYNGGGAATQSIAGLGFSPDCVVVLPPVGGNDGRPVITTSTLAADTSFDFDATMLPDTIRALEADGFQVGNGSASEPNLTFAGRTFHYVAWNAVPGKMAVGTYQGDGADNRNLDVVGFFPEWVLIKKWPDGSLNRPWTAKPASTGVGTDAAYRFSDGTSGALIPDSIQTLRPLGFQVGQADRVNSNTDCAGPCTYYWVAFGPLAPQTNLRSIGTRAHYGTGETDGNGSSVTATFGSTVVTCSGTCQWRTFNRGRGDLILIDGVPYTVGALQSESQLLLTDAYQGPSSGGKAYSIQRQFGTLQAWENCISFNSDGGAGSDACTYFDVQSASLVADHRSEVGIAYNDSAVPSAVDFTAGVKINGGATNDNTDPTHTITLTADPGNRHLGIPGGGVRITNGGTQGIWILDDYVTVEWLEVESTGVGGIYVQSISPGSGTIPDSRIVIRNNLVHGIGFGISLDDGNMAADVYNNIVYQTANAIRVVSATLFGWTQIRVLNNTMYDYTGSGFDSSVTTLPQQLTLANNIAADVDNGGTAFALAGPVNAASRSNLSANSTSTDPTAGIGANPPYYASPGGGGLANLNTTNDVDFVNAGAFNLHIQATSAAVNAAVNLSTILNTDIDAGVRQAPWDIGADDQAATTAVKLQSFGATGLDASVRLDWRTASELRNLGFHLYRSLTSDGPWTRLTTALVPGLGSSAVGQSYSFSDEGLENGTRYYYRLEDVDAASKVTSHGPVSAVPQAGAAGAGEPGRDASRGKKTEASASCPAWVLSAYGSAAGPDAAAASLRCTRHGEPEATSFAVLSRDSRQATVELRTGGFYALHEGSGAVRVFVPGFDFPQDEASTALPYRRALVEAVAGRRVELGEVRALELQAFRELVPAALGKAEMQVGRDGTVRAGRRGLRLLEDGGALRRTRARRNASAAGSAKSELVRLLPSQFQGETKSAVLELSPLRWEAQRQQLGLAKRVRVKLLFTGREAGESGRGSVGRAPRSRQTPPSGAVLTRLYTTQPGLHAATFEQLVPGGRRGVSVSELRLERQGEAVAFHVEPQTGVFGPGSRLFFHADREAASTDYTGEVAYELVSSREGVRMAVASAAPGAGAIGTEPVVTRRFETNRFYQPGLLDAADPWLWEAASSGATRVVPFSLAGVSASGTAALAVELQGASESGQAVDHHVSVSVNGVLAGEARFAGKRPYRMSLSLPAAVLREGANELSLTNVADTGVTSLVFLDRMSVVHPHASALGDGRLSAVWPASGTASLAGVTGAAVVVDVTGSGDHAASSSVAPPRWLTGHAVAGGELRFEAQAGRHYEVVVGSALRSPRIAAVVPSTLRSAGNQADYLLIAPRAFLAAAEPLIARRQDQGLSAKAISFEEIATEFGHGQPSAEAIRGFLAYAYQSWSRPSPRYVVLLGDSSYDPRNFSGVSQPSPLPALWTKTSYLWTASDPLLAAVNGEDSLPDLAIGRLPATSVEQAHSLVQKVLAWEDSGQGLSGAATLVADNPDLAGDFEADVEDVRASFLAGRETSVLKVSELGASTRPLVQQALDSGLSYLGYVGHGGAAVWASENVWSTWDAESLQAQSRQPLLLTLNCLNGYFVAPSYDSLSESLVKAEGRGAIAAFSPSGLSLDGPAHQYHRALMAELTSGRHDRLGDALLAAQKTYATSGLMPELLSIYHLLGDPAMAIR